jgi:tetratricopeptide (TPR) repeat protein
LGELTFREGRWAEAERLLDEAMALARENQDAQWLLGVHALLIEQNLLQGQVEAAFARHERLLDDPDQARKLIVPSPAIGMLFLALEDFDRADDVAARALAYWGREGSSFYTWIWIALEARVLAARERWPEAEAAFEDATARARRTRYVFYEAQALQWHGEMLAGKGEIGQAQERLHQARAIYVRLGAAPYLALTDDTLARLGP